MKKILIYGFGNIGRQDDGLGVLLTTHMEELLDKNSIYSVEVESNYQLNIEDALTISHYDIVFFADTTIDDSKAVDIQPVIASPETEFTMHAMQPAFVLHLCQSLYNVSPETYIITMHGFEFEFGMPVTEQALSNLNMAISLLSERLNRLTDGVFHLSETAPFTLNH